MQLSAAAAKDMGVNRFDPEQNIIGGARYYKTMVDALHDPYTAAAGYHLGPRIKKFVEKAGSNQWDKVKQVIKDAGNPSDTIQYVERFKRNMNG
jgi:soluble lytic murein transglycosylase-like protein